MPHSLQLFLDCRSISKLRRDARTSVVASLVLLVGLVPARAQPTEDPIPVLAYYYIWFDAGSWERAKSDLPLLGPYSSDDAQVARQHIQWAKQVEIQKLSAEASYFGFPTLISFASRWRPWEVDDDVLSPVAYSTGVSEKVGSPGPGDPPGG